ncbi:MAG: 50S ribosomal protein L5 [Candidatus Delongbacteria bacterium]|jgi:large subunit ribosomal protein L5|nr:50S ribosomal protein L5 [Candidatus Delongbacteria bacterium]
MAYKPNFQKKYEEEIIPKLKDQFQYTSIMEIPRIEKIVINQGIGDAITDKKLITTAMEELALITGQNPVTTHSKRDISNFKVRKGMPIGVRVTLRRHKMYEFLERLVRSVLPRIRDFKGVGIKFDGKGNYTLGVNEQIIFPEINLDKVNKIMGMNITLVTTAKTDEEAYALLTDFGIPFKNKQK